MWSSKELHLKVSRSSSKLWQQTVAWRALAWLATVQSRTTGYNNTAEKPSMRDDGASVCLHAALLLDLGCLFMTMY
jgi:hypothetical protein